MNEPLSILLPYQRRWLADQSQVKVSEKSRRIGITWTEAADRALGAQRVGTGEGGNRASQMGRARARREGGGREEGRGSADQGPEQGRRRSDQSGVDGDIAMPAHLLTFRAFSLVSSRAESAESRDPGSFSLPLPVRRALRNCI